MPLYEYIDDDTNRTISVVQSMNDVHEYIDETGKKWRRVFTVPQMGIDTRVDIMDSKGFAEKSGKKKGTLGNLFDASKEASLKREKMMGKDPWVEESRKKWKERRKGKSRMSPKHPSEISQNWDITVK
jgi:predicted nucleic acid-binding Zn ribbon protein